MEFILKKVSALNIDHFLVKLKLLLKKAQSNACGKVNAAVIQSVLLGIQRQL